LNHLGRTWADNQRNDAAAPHSIFLDLILRMTAADFGQLIGKNNPKQVMSDSDKIPANSHWKKYFKQVK